MKYRLAAAAALAMTLTGCVADDGYYGPDAPYADVDYDGYYDGFYGPFYGGYWGAGDNFYYWDQGHRHYHRDAGGHFSRSSKPGFNAIRGHAPAARGHAARR